MVADRKLITEFKFHNYDGDEEMDLAVSTVGERIEIMMGGPAFIITIGQAERLLSALLGGKGGFVSTDPAEPLKTGFHLGGQDASSGRFFIGIWDILTD